MPQFKQEITSAVETWWPKPIVPTQTISATSVVTDAAQVTPGAAAWSAHVADAAAGEQLLAVWYRRDPTWHVWVALPELQKLLRKSTPTAGPLPFSAALPATNFQRCLDGGTYRIEFYRQGQRAGQGVDDECPRGFVPNFDARLNLAVCTPPYWKRDDQTSQGEPRRRCSRPSTRRPPLGAPRRSGAGRMHGPTDCAHTNFRRSWVDRLRSAGSNGRRTRRMAPHVVYPPRSIGHRTNQASTPTEKSTKGSSRAPGRTPSPCSAPSQARS